MSSHFFRTPHPNSHSDSGNNSFESFQASGIQEVKAFADVALLQLDRIGHFNERLNEVSLYASEGLFPRNG